MASLGPVDIRRGRSVDGALRTAAPSSGRVHRLRLRIFGKHGAPPSLPSPTGLRDESGQVLVIGLILCVGLFLVSISVANIGMMVAEKIHVQDTVDASAYSAAVVEARYMNLSAYVNRAIVANYNSMAFNTALWATIDADDHGIAVVTALLYQIDAVLILFPITTALGVDLDEFIDLVRDYVHHPLHLLNSKLNETFAQDDDSIDVNSYIEGYNIYVLSFYQGLLYAALQSSRHEVAQQVAHKMDPNISTTSVLGFGAEAVSYDELARAVDFVVRDPDQAGIPAFASAFDRMFGNADDPSPQPLFLPATIEASLDRFTAGRTRDGELDGLRSFGFNEQIIPGAGAIETVVDIACEIATFGFGDCDSELSLTLGARLRDGFESRADQQHVPFITRQRMREVNFFGLDFHMSGFPGADTVSQFLGNKGHTSAEKHADVGNVANSTFSFSEGLTSLLPQTILSQGFCAVGEPIPTCGLNSMNIIEASLMLPASILVPPLVVDDHWDGAFEDIEPVDSWQLIPPGTGLIDPVEYEAKVLSDGAEEGVPRYDWKVDLDNLGFPTYMYPITGAKQRPAGSSGGGGANNLLTGPSVAVMGVKPANKIHNLQGLGIGNEYSISAVSRAQVYYVRNPNRPDERPSLFNPHWVARLAPLDSEDTPVVLSEGLPYLGSLGVPVKPTH